MKKLILSVAILAVAASCSKNEVVETAQTTQIGFTTLNDRVVSKSANDANADYQIYAAKSTEIDGSVWYIDNYVACGNSETAYAPNGGPYYWPTDGTTTLSFYAFAPYGCTNIATFTATHATIPLAYTVPENADEDFTVAVPQTGLESDSEGVTSGAVSLTFSHMLAKITVDVVLDETTMANYGISTGEETDDFEGAYSTEDDTDAPFTATFTPVGDTFTVDAIYGTAATTSTLSEAVSYSEATSYMIAPQAFLGCKLQINGITVRKLDDGTTFFPGGVGVDLSEIVLDGTELNADGVVTTTSAFVAGTQYNFTVTIYNTSTEEGEDPAIEIKASATTAGWGTATEVAVDAAEGDPEE